MGGALSGLPLPPRLRRPVEPAGFALPPTFGRGTDMFPGVRLRRTPRHRPRLRVAKQPEGLPNSKGTRRGRTPAEGVGFEPTEPVNPAQQFSRLSPSSARPSLQLVLCAPRRRAPETQSSSVRRLQPSYPITPEKHRLGLLPFGPDPIHGTLAVWDPAFNTAFPLLSELRTPSGGGSAPHEEGFG